MAVYRAKEWAPHVEETLLHSALVSYGCTAPGCVKANSRKGAYPIVRHGEKHYAGDATCALHAGKRLLDQCIVEHGVLP
jgi:hypothetical protein